MLVNVADTSWNMIEFSPKTLGGYSYTFHDTADVVARHDHDLGTDMRRWRPDKGVFSVIGEMLMPSAFKVASDENITVGLWFPDASKSLVNNTRLNVQLAQTVSGGYWDGARGINMLPHQIQVAEKSNTTCFTITYSTI